VSAIFLLQRSAVHVKYFTDQSPPRGLSTVRTSYRPARRSASAVGISTLRRVDG